MLEEEEEDEEGWNMLSLTLYISDRCFTSASEIDAAFKGQRSGWWCIFDASSAAILDALTALILIIFP